MAGTSRVVFVGNIPYDLTEPQLVDIFQEVGPVISFRLVFDRETGKPRGYGFCTYPDPETAASAVRNLNGYDVGGRQLRIAFAESDKEDSGARDNRGDQRQAQPAQPVVAPMPNIGGMPTLMQQPIQSIPMHASIIPQIPGMPIAPMQAMPTAIAQQPIASLQPMQAPLQPMAASNAEPSTEAVRKAIAAFPPDQLVEVLSQLRMHVQTNVDQVRTLLNQNPQLGYALFQALMTMNVGDPTLLKGAFDTAT
ncbi:hypothetical protein HDU85_000656 [Gaertneriomyces sp. JEL0708]|nr:hypothetical protein HDU85_000656 [Gaertneriomyces sp. JEL0708]